MMRWVWNSLGVVGCIAAAGLFSQWFLGTRSPLSLATLFSPIDANRHNTPLTEMETEVGQLSSPNTEAVSYEILDLPHSLVHIVRIPPNAPVTIQPMVASTGLDAVEDLAQQQGAIAAINGGFFDPNNQQTTSYVTVDGSLVLDPEQNRGLMDNPNVTTYLSSILNRSEFRRYQCAVADRTGVQYAIAVHNQLVPAQCQLTDALGAGPALLPEFRGEAEAFIDVANNRDALGAARPNARSGLGITADGALLLIMAAQRPYSNSNDEEMGRESSGVSLFELADIMADLGVEQGINLDGGSSSSLYYNGTTHYGRLDSDGNEIRRAVKSILVVTPASTVSPLAK